MSETMVVNKFLEEIPVSHYSIVDAGQTPRHLIICLFFYRYEIAAQCQFVLTYLAIHSIEHDWFDLEVAG